LNGLFLCVFVFTFQFAIFYAVSTLMAVLTRSPIVAILATVVTWFVLWGLGLTFQALDALRPEKLAKEQAKLEQLGQPRAVLPELPGWLFTTADIVHFIAPGYKDLDVLTTRLIRADLVDPKSPQAKDLDVHMDSIRWNRTIPVTLIFIGLMLGLSCWRFATKDY
jgi:hypothetical protein